MYTSQLFHFIVIIIIYFFSFYLFLFFFPPLSFILQLIYRDKNILM